MVNTDSITKVNLNLGLNLAVGSIPLSLRTDLSSETKLPDTITFEGCMQTADINLTSFMSYLGQQFGVDVQLPPELNLEAQIDYLVGQVTYTQSGPTQLSATAKFDLTYQNGGTKDTFTFTFYADTEVGASAPASGNPYVVGGCIDNKLYLSKLPLVGDVPILNELIIDNFGFTYTNESPTNGQQSFTIPPVTTSANPLYTSGIPPTGTPSPNSSIYRIGAGGNQRTFNINQNGFSITAGLLKETGSDTVETQGSFALPAALPTATNGNTPAQYYHKKGAKIQSTPPSGPIHWLNVNKTFGPVDIQKIGLNYNAGEASFGLSAGFSVGGFSMLLEGLSITFPLPLPGMPAGKTISFNLNGLGLNFDKSGIDIAGSFLKVEGQDTTNYFGEAIVEVGDYGLTAIGGYSPAQADHPAAFFIYGNLDGPLGGAPFLYVTGLAFGFGINYSLNLPTISHLSDYLLLPHNAPAPAGSPSDAMATVLPELIKGNVVVNKPGEDWLAAGVQFTSFNMVSAFALATVSFGVETEIGILGRCSVTLPKGDPDPLAYIDIDLESSFNPSSGLFPVVGVISPSSFVLNDAVRLNGGFAFYIWYAGEHSGNFVFTVGGYSPNFEVPSYYPAVPRLSINFSLGPFHASGSAYAALTPGMFMAGLSYSATWSVANISAWYSAGVDFIIQWAPFTYRAQAYVSVGCSVDLALFTIHASVGADAIIWGPSFGGQAHVDLDVVSFTISFGSSQVTPTPVSWSELNQKFLQSSNSTQQSERYLSADVSTTDSVSNVTASVAKGLRKTTKTKKKKVSGPQKNITYDWVIDPNNFVIVTATKIPANATKWITGNGSSDFNPISNTLPVSSGQFPQIQLGENTETFSDTQIWNPDLDIRPMDKSDVGSTLSIQLVKADENGHFTDYITDIGIEPIVQNSNAALWGKTSESSNINYQLVKGTLVGFKIIPSQRNPERVNKVALIDLLFSPGNHVSFSWSSAQPNTDYTVSSSLSDGNLTITIGGESTKVLTDEHHILSSLTKPWVEGKRNKILDDLDRNGFSTYSAAEVNPIIMASEEQLDDWPRIKILGTE